MCGNRPAAVRNDRLDMEEVGESSDSEMDGVDHEEMPLGDTYEVMVRDDKGTDTMKIFAMHELPTSARA